MSTSGKPPKKTAATKEKKLPDRPTLSAIAPKDFDKLIKNGPVRGAFIFYGEENYLKRAYLNKLRKAIFGESGGDPFNHIFFDADTYSPGDLAEAIQTLPVMSEYKLVELRGLDFGRADMSEGLCDALDILSDYEYTVIIIYTMPGEFDAGSEKRPSKTFSELSKYSVPVEFAHESPARLASWIERHFEADGVSASPELCAELIAFSGRDMTTLDGEISKLSAYVLSNGRDRVTVTDIKAVCSAAGEINAFALANAVLDGNYDGALTALRESLSRRERPEILLASISRVFCDLYTIKICADAGMGKRDIALKLKLHEYKAGLYLNACKKYSAEALGNMVEKCRMADLKLKSTSIDSEVILHRLALEKI